MRPFHRDHRSHEDHPERVVLLVAAAPESTPDPHHGARAAAARGAELLVLCLGYPLTEAQRAVERRARSLAWEHRIVVTTELVLCADQIRSLIAAGDAELVRH